MLEELERTVAELRGAIAQSRVPAVSDDLRETLREASATLMRLQLVLDRGGDDLTATLENLRAATQNLRDASETARTYPSFLLFGAPPQPSLDPGAKEDGR